MKRKQQFQNKVNKTLCCMSVLGVTPEGSSPQLPESPHNSLLHKLLCVPSITTSCYLNPPTLSPNPLSYGTDCHDLTLGQCPLPLGLFHLLLSYPRGYHTAFPNTLHHVILLLKYFQKLNVTFRVSGKLNYKWTRYLLLQLLMVISTPRISTDERCVWSYDKGLSRLNC